MIWLQLGCLINYIFTCRQSSIVQSSTLYEFGEMEDIKIKLGLRVKEIRISKGYSQEQLAELADLDRTYIPGIESGKRNVSIVVVEKLARAFDITISDLLKHL